MKKEIRTLAALLVILALTLAACGSKASFDAGKTEDFNGGYGADQDYAPSTPDDYDYKDDSVASPGYDGVESESDTGMGWDGSLSDAGQSVMPQRSLSEKIIYSADVEIETVKFDEAVEAIQDMLDKYGAFLESSRVSGKSYSATVDGRPTYRTAHFVVRVPVERFAEMRDGLGSVGAVLNTYNYTDNITERYMDVQSRLDSYRIEQERLMAMLEKCETVSDMLEIESRLSDVRYQLESLESTLRNWQNQIDYSTIDITLSEVQEYTKQVEIHRSYWQEISDGLKDTLESIGEFFKDAFRDIVIALPVLLILAACVTVVIVLIVKTVKRRRRSRPQPTESVTGEIADGSGDEK